MAEADKIEASIGEAIYEVQKSLDDMGAAASPDGETAIIADRAESEITDRLSLLGDVDLQVMIELGRTEMLVEDVLKLGNGSVVELDKLAGDPVDVYVNQRLIARGEVLVLNDSFCIRISEIVEDLEEQTEAVLAQQQDAAR